MKYPRKRLVLENRYSHKTKLITIEVEECKCVKGLGPAGGVCSACGRAIPSEQELAMRFRK